MESIKIEYIIGITIVIICLLGVFILESKTSSLGNIKSKRVGDGQHGSASWMNKKEKKKYFTTVKMPKKLVDMSDSWLPGRIIDFNVKTRELTIDTSDSHGNIKAPSGTGKTTVHLIPNIQYNMCAGTSMILPDLKGELKRLTEEDAIRLGYKTFTFDFVNLVDSATIDLFDDINENMELYLRTDDIIAKANSESLAAELADEISCSRSRGSAENKFFLGASKGLNQSVILLLSMFASSSQKHLSSVRATLQNIASMPKDRKDPSPAIVKLIADMPEDFGAKKQMGAAFAASSETEDNIYASALDDLRPFNDALVEQIISVPQKPGKFNYKELIDHKTIVYIVLPAEKQEFKIIGKVVLKKIIQQLGNYASKSKNGKLPRIVKVLWEEFAEYPKIENVESWLQVKRGQGVLFDLIYQDESALKEKYGENIPKTLKNNCGCSIILGVAPEDRDYAKTISEILGNYTIQSGTTSVSQNNNSFYGGNSKSISRQMMSKPLMEVDEVLQMESKGIQIILNSGKKPMKTKLVPYYSKGWGIVPTPKSEDQKVKNQFYKIEYMPFDDLRTCLINYARKHNPKLHQPSKDPTERVAEYLFDLTSDVNVKKMVLEAHYVDLMKLMQSKYPERISKLDLTKLLESIAN